MRKEKPRFGGVFCVIQYMLGFGLRINKLPRNFTQEEFPILSWILAANSWNDSGVWVDSETWID
jgi:hypothetical protein